MNLLRLCIISIFIGIFAGIFALTFYLMLKYGSIIFLGKFAGYYPPEAGYEGNINWIPSDNPFKVFLVLLFGGLISGIIVYSLAPEAEGHGTDAAIRAFHKENGYVRRRIPFVKMIASTFTISTGGSAGREGPIAHISSGVGSMIADLFKLSIEERRYALAIGIGAGVGSIFKAPLGGALLSAEILYRRDFEKEILIPAIVASIIGYTLFGYIIGFEPVFRVDYKYDLNLLHLPLFFILGVLSAGVGILYIKSFYKTFYFFKKLNIPKIFKPMIGSGIVGIIVIFLYYTTRPEIAYGALSMGYGFIQLAIDNKIVLESLFALIFLKILFTSLTIGSGGSGGVFAPGLFIGAMLGGFFGKLLNILFPNIVDEDDIFAFVIVGMMSLFGGVSKAPIAVLVMVAEMTKEYELLFPALISIVVAYLLTGNESIYSEQVINRMHSPAHMKEYFMEIIRIPKVKEFVRKEFPIIYEGETVESVIRKIRFFIPYIPVFKDERVIGYIKMEDLLKNDLKEKIDKIIERKVVKCNYNESILKALEIMNRENSELLFVYENDKLVGILLRDDISKILSLKEHLH